MGEPPDMVEIPSTPRVYGAMLGAISFSVPTARMALMADVPARLAEFRDRSRCESNCPQDASGAAPMPPHPRTDPACEYRTSRTTETGTRRILPAHRGPRRAVCKMSYA